VSKLDQFHSSSGRVWDEKHQKHINVETLTPRVQKRPRPKQFEVKFVRVSHYWMEQLGRARHIATYKLALNILRQDHERTYGCRDEIVLSSTATGLPRATRHDAIKELVTLGLIRTEQMGHGAVRVVELVSRKPNGTTIKFKRGKIPRSSWRT
jgi:hypothetical protein